MVRSQTTSKAHGLSFFPLLFAFLFSSFFIWSPEGATKRIAGFEAFPHMGLKKSPNDQFEAAVAGRKHQ